MTLPLRKIVWHNAPLKIISIILGYTLWYSFSAAHMASSWLTIPVCFYNTPAQAALTGPDAIRIQVRGKRTDLRMLDHENIAVHIDATTLAQGRNKLVITNETLLLPDSIKLVHYAPTNPYIEYHNNHVDSELS